MNTYDPKIVALGNAASRTARRGFHPLLDGGANQQRFVNLWKARNRRVRVQMRKLRRAAGDLAW